MNTHEETPHEDIAVRKKTLIVLGLTFMVPILGTLIAIYVLM